MNREESDKLWCELLDTYHRNIQSGWREAADRLWRAIETAQITPEQTEVLRAVGEWHYSEFGSTAGIYKAYKAYKALERKEKMPQGYNEASVIQDLQDDATDRFLEAMREMESLSAER